MNKRQTVCIIATDLSFFKFLSNIVSFHVESVQSFGHENSLILAASGQRPAASVMQCNGIHETNRRLS